MVCLCAAMVTSHALVVVVTSLFALVSAANRQVKTFEANVTMTQVGPLHETLYQIFFTCSFSSLHCSYHLMVD